MKRKLSAILACVMLTAALAGCAGSKNETSESKQTSSTSGAAAESSTVSESSKTSGQSEKTSETSQTSQASQTSQTSQASQISEAEEPDSESSVKEDSQPVIITDPETGEQILVLDPEASGNYVIEEVDSDDPFMELSYNIFEISGSGLGSAKLPEYRILTNQKELKSFIEENKTRYSLDSAYVGSEENKRLFEEYAAVFNDDFFEGQDLMILVVACSASGECDLGDIVLDDDGNASVEVWGSTPASDSDKKYECFAVSYAKGALDGKTVTITLTDLAAGEGEE